MNGNWKTNAEETKEGDKSQVEKTNGDLCKGILLAKGKKLRKYFVEEKGMLTRKRERELSGFSAIGNIFS